MYLQVKYACKMKGRNQRKSTYASIFLWIFNENKWKGKTCCCLDASFICTLMLRHRAHIKCNCHWREEMEWRRRRWGSGNPKAVILLLQVFKFCIQCCCICFFTWPRIGRNGEGEATAAQQRGRPKLNINSTRKHIWMRVYLNGGKGEQRIRRTKLQQ